MRLRSRSTRTLAALAALAFAAAACGDDDTTDTGGPSAAPSSTAAPGGPAGSTTTAPEATGPSTVEVADSELGEILASDGRTLYTFMPDNGGAPSCYDDCAATWPPLLADGDVAVADGLDAGLFVMVARNDGGEQVTVDGWPLYFFANDTAPGDTNGQGVGDRWFVVGPDGAAIQGAADDVGY